jgi:hypothetical protein
VNILFEIYKFVLKQMTVPEHKIRVKCFGLCLVYKTRVILSNTGPYRPGPWNKSQAQNCCLLWKEHFESFIATASILESIAETKVSNGPSQLCSLSDCLLLLLLLQSACQIVFFTGEIFVDRGVLKSGGACFLRHLRMNTVS